MPSEPPDPPAAPDRDPDEDVDAVFDDAAPPSTAEEAVAAVEAFVESAEGTSVARGQVRAKLPRSASDATVEDLAQETLVTALEKAATLRDPARVRPWVAAIARNVVRAWRRSGAAEQRRLTRKAELEAQRQAMRAEDAGRGDGFLVSDWIVARAQGSARDLATIDMLFDRARAGKSYGDLAAERGTTARAVAKRVQYLRDKYAPMLERDRAAARRAERRRAVLLVAGLLVLFAVALALYYLLRRPPVRMGPDLHRSPPAAPVESLAPPPTFEPALPTGPDKPGR